LPREKSLAPGNLVSVRTGCLVVCMAVAQSIRHSKTSAGVVNEKRGQKKGAARF